MAKWGEGDPRWVASYSGPGCCSISGGRDIRGLVCRWVVEHREDGTNVNGWHWEDKNRFSWTKQRLPELFQGLAADMPQDEGSVSIVDIKTVTGEVRLKVVCYRVKTS
jgi:hypothetical protein